MKNKVNLDYHLLLKQTLELYNTVIVVGFAFHYRQQMLSAGFLRLLFV